ncbi:MAG: hypothetical protein NPIRA02_02630 [Nitrospirales bacterium]|nr:MAG: hypothetical protein NPIRA02_02630 [Nitrospirales bacterium]
MNGMGQEEQVYLTKEAWDNRSSLHLKLKTPHVSRFIVKDMGIETGMMG